METKTANKQYKNLGNAIRESVFRAKEALTMLPDETIEKLGLGEDDIMSMEEEVKHKVGDTVTAKIGPHKGAKHTVIHDHGNGKYNVQPVGLHPKHIRYRLGAATAKGSDLEPHSKKNEEYEYIDELINEALRHGKDSFALRKTAEELATQLASQIGNMHLPDPDSVRYERPKNSYKKDETKATKQLDIIISQLESLSKLISRSTL
jgi:hypothetical protein